MESDRCPQSLGSQATNMLIALGFRLRGIAANRPLLHRSAYWLGLAPNTISHAVQLSERRVGSQTKVSAGQTRYGEQPNASMRGQHHRMSCINLRTIEMLAPE